MVDAKLEQMPREHPESSAKNLTCGTCQWVSSGYDNKNCRVVRGVEVTTKACVEYTAVYQDRFYDMAKDKYIQDVRKELKHNKFKVHESIISELDGYITNSLDSSKFSFGSKQDLETIARTLLQIVSYRARVSTIYTAALDIRAELDEKVAYVNLWLNSKFSKVMKELRNEEQRNAALHRVMPDIIPIEKNLSKLISKAKYLDEQLNRNEWTLRAVMDSAGRLVNSKEGLQRMGNYGN